VYSFLPHCGGFSAENVIQPAYELNVPAVIGKGDFSLSALAVPSASNIIVEAVKPCEDNEKAFIIRLYEAEGTQTVCSLKLFDGAKDVKETNMLEEVIAPADCASLSFRPFEIKTLKVSY
jgi:alpha-mannosidase